MSHEAPPGDCRNCGVPAPGAYCPACGQETAQHPPSAREFLHEFIGHYVALEGALWRTLKALAVPGKLTIEYFAGRRRQYVLPLRLYLTASLLFFLAVKVIAPHAQVRVITPGAALTGVTQPGGARPSLSLSCDEDAKPCQIVSARLTERYGELSQEKLGAVVRDHLVAYAPYAMFLLLPFFAFLTRVAYWPRQRNYGEHLVFAFHVHSLAFLAGIVAVLAGQMLIATIAASIYLGVALGRVFGGRIWAQVLRFLFIFLTYFVVIVVLVMAIAIAALLF